METTFNPQESIKSMTCALARFAWPLALIVLITALTGALTYEAGQFFGGLGWGKAALVEIVALSLIAYRPTGFLDWIAKFIVLAGAFSIVVYGAAYHAARPHMEADAMTAADKMRIESLSESIAGYRASLDGVKGQSLNSAVAARELRDAIAEKDAFVKSIKPDMIKATANNLAVLTAIAFRVILQLGNWLLAHRLVAFFRRREKSDEPAPKPQQAEVKSLPEPEPSQESPVGKSLHINDNTLNVLKKLSASTDHEAKRIVLQQARCAPSTIELDKSLDSLMAAGVIDVIPAAKMTDTVYRLRNGNGRA